MEPRSGRENRRLLTLCHAIAGRQALLARDDREHALGLADHLLLVLCGHVCAHGPVAVDGHPFEGVVGRQLAGRALRLARFLRQVSLPLQHREPNSEAERWMRRACTTRCGEGAGGRTCRRGPVSGSGPIVETMLCVRPAFMYSGSLSSPHWSLSTGASPSARRLSSESACAPPVGGSSLERYLGPGCVLAPHPMSASASARSTEEPVQVGRAQVDAAKQLMCVEGRAPSRARRSKGQVRTCKGARNTLH